MDISWERLGRIFNHPKPPATVWERQFDYFDKELQRLAQTPWDEVDFSDLWYYHHDLAYVELQPELFHYLFPVCLMDWHQTLLNNQSCSHGDSEFHYGVHQGKIFERMVSPEQKAAIYEFFRDSFLVRLDQERGFVYQGSKTPAYGWMCRMNSLGIIMPRIDLLWNAWWSLETPGRAVAAIQYCSGLIYLEGENPLFPPWTQDSGGGGPYLWATDSLISDAGWMSENLQFLQEVLTVQFVSDKLHVAAELLAGEPEHTLAKQVESDWADRREIVESRVRELPTRLSVPGTREWSI